VEAAILPWLSPSARLLDLGCGEGSSTLRFAQGVTAALGIDYVDGFVHQARANAAQQGQDNCTFETGSVLDLSAVRAAHGRFDAVVAIRCLINLESWERQREALAELAACVAPGGLLLLSEGWAEGFRGLNLRRGRVGLPEMQVAPYNLLMQRDLLEAECRRWLDFVGYRGLGLYLYLSRVVQPLFVAPDSPSHTHPLNRVAAGIQAADAAADPFADCDYAGVYVWRRRPD
jgi:ubiquinone/menaquinone biosynthesis C-methylase UbiE